MTLNFELICPVKKWLKLALAHFFIHSFDILFLIFVKVSFDTFLEADFQKIHGSELDRLGFQVSKVFLSLNRRDVLDIKRHWNRPILVLLNLLLELRDSFQVYKFFALSLEKYQLFIQILQILNFLPFHLETVIILLLES